jgi:hypothetical protein
MLKIILIAVAGLVIGSLIDDHIERKKLVKKIKIGDKKRIFTDNEVTFEIVEVIDIFYKKNKKYAKIKYENGYIEELPASELIY